MTFQPNIDQRGADLRLTASRIVLFIAAIVLFIPGLSRSVDLAIFGVLSIVGLVMRLEARKKWCVLRACGIKTAL